LFSRFACFGVEADEQFACQCDAHDHLWLSGRCELAVECVKALVEAACDVSDQKQDRPDAGTAAADMSLAGLGAAIVGERRQAGQFDHPLLE